MICETPATRIHYAVGDGLIDYCRAGRFVIVNPAEISQKIIDGTILKTTYMIKRSLRAKGVWEDSWADSWEAPEKPMTEEDYLAWIKEKVAICGEDKTMGIKERIDWAERGYDFGVKTI